MNSQSSYPNSMQQALTRQAGPSSINSSIVNGAQSDLSKTKVYDLRKIQLDIRNSIPQDAFINYMKVLRKQAAIEIKDIDTLRTSYPKEFSKVRFLKSQDPNVISILIKYDIGNLHNFFMEAIISNSVIVSNLSNNGTLDQYQIYMGFPLNVPQRNPQNQDLERQQKINAERPSHDSTAKKQDTNMQEEIKYAPVEKQNLRFPSSSYTNTLLGKRNQSVDGIESENKRLKLDEIGNSRTASFQNGQVNSPPPIFAVDRQPSNIPKQSPIQQISQFTIQPKPIEKEVPVVLQKQEARLLPVPQKPIKNQQMPAINPQQIPTINNSESLNFEQQQQMMLQQQHQEIRNNNQQQEITQEQMMLMQHQYKQQQQQQMNRQRQLQIEQMQMNQRSVSQDKRFRQYTVSNNDIMPPITLYRSRSADGYRQFQSDSQGNYMMQPLLNEQMAREIQPLEIKDGRQFVAFGGVHEYNDRFKVILKKYLLMKYTQKKDNKERQKMHQHQMNTLMGNETAVFNEAKPNNQTSADPSPSTMEYIRKTLNETAARNGLKFKKLEQQTQLIHSQLAVMLEKILQKIKLYFEEEIQINWEEFEPYPQDASDQQKLQQDWSIFFMSLRNQSMRYILIDKPDFFGDAKLAAYMKEKLL